MRLLLNKFWGIGQYKYGADLQLNPALDNNKVGATYNNSAQFGSQPQLLLQFNPIKIMRAKRANLVTNHV